MFPRRKSAGKDSMRKTAPNESRFSNRIYRAELQRTPVGSPIVKLIPTNPSGHFAGHRQIAAFVYEMAAEMERRSDELGARWVISPEPANARVVVELANDLDAVQADEFIASVLADNDLI